MDQAPGTCYDWYVVNSNNNVFNIFTLFIHFSGFFKVGLSHCSTSSNTRSPCQHPDINSQRLCRLHISIKLIRCLQIFDFVNEQDCYSRETMQLTTCPNVLWSWMAHNQIELEKQNRTHWTLFAIDCLMTLGNTIRFIKNSSCNLDSNPNLSPKIYSKYGIL